MLIATILLSGVVARGPLGVVNRILGEERLLTGPEAGITRDAIALDWSWRGRPIKLHDTAGMRRKAKVQARLEQLSVADTLRERLASFPMLNPNPIIDNAGNSVRVSATPRARAKTSVEPPGAKPTSASPAAAAKGDIARATVPRQTAAPRTGRVTH